MRELTRDALQQKWTWLSSLSDDQLRVYNSNRRQNFGAYNDPVYAFRPELREKFRERTLTNCEYNEITRDALYKRVDRSIDRLARKYGFRGKLLSRRLMTVGVQGDYRTYGYVAEILTDAELDYDRPAELATKIPNEIAGINRIVLRLNKI